MVNLPKSDIELAILFEICGDSPEKLVLGNILPGEVAYDGPLILK